MEFKGTKGKWSVGNNDKTGKTEKPIVKSIEDGKMVCMLPPLSEDTENNAQLISKAPEMLDMLKRVDETGFLDDWKVGEDLKQLIKEATTI